MYFRTWNFGELSYLYVLTPRTRILFAQSILYLAMDNMSSFVIDSAFNERPFTLLRHSWLPHALSILIIYPLFVASFRYHRIRSLEKKHPYPTRESYATMTDNEAFEIINQTAELEFPTLFEKALQFALFRVRLPLPLPTS